MDVNVRGTLNVLAAVLPSMRARKAGSIVNISSLAAVAGNHMVAYEMSKAAVNWLTISTALSNAKYCVRVNAVAPGFMDTPMAIDSIVEATGAPVDEIRAKRNQ
jgi:NAD(P)-dependent dehydrogenase (short-subunit alcohol dehydrogenase family)